MHAMPAAARTLVRPPPVRRGVRRLAIAACCAAIVVPAASASLAAQGLTPEEQRIVAAVDARTDAAITLLERTVNVNSGTFNLEGVREVGRMFRAELDALGFATRWIPMDTVGRAGHLFAERRGTGPVMVLIGHLDTVFEPDSPFQRWERVDRTTVRGPGTEDMKGGNVVMLLALQALEAAGALDGASVIVALTGDEEDTGDPLDVARRDLIAAGRRATYALGFEGATGEGRSAVVARRGFTGWVVRATATPAHSSQIFRADLGSGAVFELVRVLHTFHDRLRGEQYLTFNPGIVAGGTDVEFDGDARATVYGKTNIIAEHALAAGDLRTISFAQRDSAKTRMRAIVAASLPHAASEITFRDSYPPMSPTDANYALLARLSEVSRDLGFGPVDAVDPGARGAADVSFVAPHVTAALDGLGVIGSGGHTVEETMQLPSVAMQAKKAAVLIYRLSREGR